MKKYAAEIHHFISENVKGTTTRDLVKIVNEKFGTDFTESKMKSYKQNHKLKSETPVGLPAGSPTSLYPEEIKNFIKQNYIGVGHKDMADLLNKTFGTSYTIMQMKAYYGNRGIDSGLNGQFQPGSTPFNKGKKGLGGWEPTQFKKGHKPHNYKPVGTVRVNADNYVDIKIADPNKWKGKHIIVWEKRNGPVPRGCVVIFGDGNRRNFDPDNLILVSRKQLALMNKNGLIQNNADLTRTGIIMADIIQIMGERKRRKTQKTRHGGRGALELKDLGSMPEG